MGEEAGESQPTLEEKIDIILARQDEIAEALEREGVLDSELKTALKVLIYLLILLLVILIVRLILVPVISYI